MIGEWIAGLEATGVAAYLRNSAWAYPLVNASHILGVALLVGGTVPLNLRLLGVGKALPLRPIWRALTGTSGIGLVLVVGAGILLFSARATRYVQSGIFFSKMLLVGVGILSTVLVRLCVTESRLRAADAGSGFPIWLRCVAGLLLLLWPSALVLGRLIGYF